MKKRKKRSAMSVRHWDYPIPARIDLSRLVGPHIVAALERVEGRTADTSWIIDDDGQSHWKGKHPDDPYGIGYMDFGIDIVRDVQADLRDEGIILSIDQVISLLSEYRWNRGELEYGQIDVMVGEHPCELFIKTRLSEVVVPSLITMDVVNGYSVSEKRRGTFLVAPAGSRTLVDAQIVVVKGEKSSCSCGLSNCKEVNTVRRLLEDRKRPARVEQFSLSTETATTVAKALFRLCLDHGLFQPEKTKRKRGHVAPKPVNAALNLVLHEIITRFCGPDDWNVLSSLGLVGRRPVRSTLRRYRSNPTVKSELLTLRADALRVLETLGAEPIPLASAFTSNLVDEIVAALLLTTFVLDSDYSRFLNEEHNDAA